MPVKKIILITLLLLPLAGLIFPALDFVNQALRLFPAENIQNRLYPLTDKPFNGKSKIEAFSTTGGKISLKYRLEEGAENPMVFLTLATGTIEEPFDLSGYESVSLVIKAATIKRMLVFIKTFVPGLSRPEPENAGTLRHNQFILELTPGVQDYTIKLKDFITPNWWLSVYNVSLTQLSKEDYKKVISFDIQFNPGSSDGVFDRQEEIEIEGITFNKSLSRLNLTLLIGVILFYAGVFSLRLIQNIRSYLREIPGQKPVEITTYYERDLGRLKEFLESNYCIPDISTRQIYEKLGISQARVTELLYNEYHLSFKQLINRMRIEEAKRLLKESDLRIIDVALNLGFNNISYFNRLFKETEGVTPSEFREQKP